MPQLDPASFASQIFWLIITFITLYIILSKYALPGIRDIIQARQDKIDSDLKKAEIAKSEAKEIESVYSKAIKEARDRASHMIKEASERLKHEMDQKYSELDNKLNLQVQHSKEKMDKIAADSKNELEQLTKNIAATIITKFANKSVVDNELSTLLKK